MTRDATTAFACALVDELVRGGVRTAVVSPGSRSAPIALALADDDRVRVEVVLDERTAGFVAIGIGQVTAMPAVVLTTSGTATANLHPAVLEAHHADVPMIVLTADRPPELRGVGAPQTIEQVGLYGPATRWAAEAEVPVDRPGAPAAWRALAARAVLEATGVRPGPVHLDLPLREPLVPTGEPLVPAPGRGDGAPWLDGPIRDVAPEPDAVGALVARVRDHRRGFLVLGPGARVDPAVVDSFAAAAGWPVLADPTGAAGKGPGVGTVEALVRHAPAAADAPSTWIRIGAVPTIRVVAEWLDRARGALIDGAGVRRDPGASVDQLVVGDPSRTLRMVVAALELPRRSTDGWPERWHERDRTARSAIDATLDAAERCTEPRVARDVVASLPADAALLVASSMPIRDVATFARPRPDVTVYANRGVNGIDGFAGTALGIAMTHTGPTVALGGDLAFLHDLGGLVAAAGRTPDLVFVVVDNGGGGIFSFLPQAALPEHFETLFGTAPAVDVGAVAAGFGLPVVEVRSPDELVPSLRGAIDAGGVRVVRIRTHRARNVADHRAVWDAVAAALSRGPSAE